MCILVCGWPQKCSHNQEVSEQRALNIFFQSLRKIRCHILMVTFPFQIIFWLVYLNCGLFLTRFTHGEKPQNNFSKNNKLMTKKIRLKISKTVAALLTLEWHVRNLLDHTHRARGRARSRIQIANSWHWWNGRSWLASTI